MPTPTVRAIRLYNRVNGTDMAEIKMSDGTIENVYWNDVKQRVKFTMLFTGYTLFYDERMKPDFVNV